MSPSRDPASKSPKNAKQSPPEAESSTHPESLAAKPPRKPAPEIIRVQSPSLSRPQRQLEVPDEATSAPDLGIDSEILRQQPISPPSEPKQYRAIGLVQGTYQPSEEQLNRGILVTKEGLEIEAVLLGQVMSLVKKYIDLAQPQLWVVYPRTRDKQQTLHLQIVGAWSAQGFGPHPSHTDEATDAAGPTDAPAAPPADPPASTAAAKPQVALLAPQQDGYFSVRGEVVFQSEEDRTVLVKIQQSARKQSQETKAFKLRLVGVLPPKALGYFWDLHVQRQGHHLVIRSGTSIALLPPQKRTQKSGRRDGGKKPFRSGGAHTPGSAHAQSKPSKPTKPVRRSSEVPPLSE